MMKIFDANDQELEVYGKWVENSDEVYRIPEERIEDYIAQLCKYYQCEPERAIDMLIDASESEPIEYYDEVIWTELPLHD